MPRMRFSWVNLDGGGERCPHSSIKVGVFVHLMGIEGRNRNPDLMKEINDLISMVSLEVVTVFLVLLHQGGTSLCKSYKGIKFNYSVILYEACLHELPCLELYLF